MISANQAVKNSQKIRERLIEEENKRQERNEFEAHKNRLNERDKEQDLRELALRQETHENQAIRNKAQTDANRITEQALTAKREAEKKLQEAADLKVELESKIDRANKNEAASRARLNEVNAKQKKVEELHAEAKKTAQEAEMKLKQAQELKKTADLASIVTKREEKALAIREAKVNEHEMNNQIRQNRLNLLEEDIFVQSEKNQQESNQLARREQAIRNLEKEYKLNSLMTAKIR